MFAMDGAFPNSFDAIQRWLSKDKRVLLIGGQATSSFPRALAPFINVDTSFSNFYLQRLILKSRPQEPNPLSANLPDSCAYR